MKAAAFLPSAVTSLRLTLLPSFLYLFTVGSSLSCLGMLVFFATTDYLDGYLARKLHVATQFGAYFDASIDFTVIFCVYTVFYASGFYPLWLIGLITFSFTQFIVTSRFSKKLYDPVGKYLGSALLIGIALTALWPTQATFSFVQYAYLALFAVSFSSRIVSLVRYNSKSLLRFFFS